MNSILKFYLIASSVVNAFLLVVIFCSLAFGETIDLDAICEIESSCLSNPATIYAKIFNPQSRARGSFQITEIALQDYLYYHKNTLYSLNDLYNFDTGKEIASWMFTKRIPQLLKHYHIPITKESMLACYNWGISNLLRYGLDKMPRETKEYIKKYKSLTK